MDWIMDPQIWIALVTLTTLEIVLGIDNIIFIAILASKLPKTQTSQSADPGTGNGDDQQNPAALISYLADAPDKTNGLNCLLVEVLRDGT